MSSPPSHEVSADKAEVAELADAQALEACIP